MEWLYGFDDHLNTIPKHTIKSCEATVIDITYIKCKRNLLYLLTMDAYSRVITGFDLRRDLTTARSMNALQADSAILPRTYGFDLKGLIFHSDRAANMSQEMTGYEDSVGIGYQCHTMWRPLHNALAEG